MSNEPLIQSTRTHVPPLDGLRGIAVLLVIWAHVPTNLGGSAVKLLNTVIQPGYLGVDIFFVLSGFLITRILLYGRCNQKSLVYFLVRRAFRIFPIYYLLIGVLIYLAPGEYLIWCATYLSNFVFSLDYLWNADLQRWIAPSNPMRHTWSLCVEEHFYMIWPLFIYFAPRDWLKPTTVAVVLTGMVLAVLAVVFAEELPLYKLLYRGTPFRMTSLALGGLFALYEPSLGIGTSRPWRFAGAFFVPAVIFLTVAALLENPWTQAMKMIGFSLMSSTIFLATIGTSCMGPKLGTVLSKGPLAYVGRISYGVYLYHYPIFYSLGLLDHEAQHTLWTTCQGVVLTFAVATTSYYLLERPILRYASRYR